MRIGIIENLPDIASCEARDFKGASAEEIMNAVGGNTGNIAFVHGAHQIIENSLVRLNWGSPISEVRKHVDHVVICCANQIGAHVDLQEWADYLEALGLPVTLLGLGAQSESKNSIPNVPHGSLNFLKTVSKLRAGNACNIGVRGQYTQQVLNSLGMDSTVIGCPSLFSSPEKNLGKLLLDRQNPSASAVIAVAAGNPWHGASAILENVLVDIVERHQGHYVLQHPVWMLQLALGEKDHLPANTITQLLNAYGGRFDLNSLSSWYKQYAKIFTNVSSWMNFLGKCDGAIGPRYHGIALAIQAGVPGCVITMDARTQELAETTQIKRIDIGEALTMKPNQLVEALWWNEKDAELFDSNRVFRARLAVNFLIKNNITPSVHLQSLCNER